MFNTLKLSEYLNKQPRDKKLVVVSFFITNSKSLKKLHEQWALRNKGHGKILKKNIAKVKTIDEDTFGGSVVLVDPLNLDNGFIAEMKIPLAFGLLVNHKNKSLYVTSGKKILEIKNHKCVKTISNSLFNDLHCITFSSKGNILVTSTGTDSILEIYNNKRKKRACWDWLATENGFDTTQSGAKRIINRNFDYKPITTITPEHTTHINSALNDKPNRILATLFHQGQLIEINRKTKKVNILLSDLKSPHNIRKKSNGFILSDSRSNRVLLLDDKFKIERILKAKFNWVQDAIEINKEQYLIADSNNYRIVLVDCGGNIKSKLKWRRDSKKIASMELIDTLEAKNIFCS